MTFSSLRNWCINTHILDFYGEYITLFEKRFCMIVIRFFVYNTERFCCSLNILSISWDETITVSRNLYDVE